MSELLPRHAFLDPLVHGARILEVGAVAKVSGESAVALHDRGAASVVSVDADPEAIAAAGRDFADAGLRFVAGSFESLAPASFDVALIHDAGLLGELDSIRRVLAPGGHLVVAIEGAGASFDPASRPGDSDGAYRELVRSLSTRFPSVEVVTQRAVVGYSLSLSHGVDHPLLIVGDAAAGDAASHFLFLCGDRPSGIARQTLSLLPAATAFERATAEVSEGEATAGLFLELAELEEELRRSGEEASGLRDVLQASSIESTQLRAGLESAREEAARLQGELEIVDQDAIGLAGKLIEAKETIETLGAELEASRVEARRAHALAKGLRVELQAAGADGAEAGEDEMGRRLRDAEERVEDARRHAREAEERMRAAERRAEAAESARAEASMAARRHRHEAEAAQRSAAGFAASLSESGASKPERNAG